MRRGALPAGLRRLRRDRPALSSTGETMPIKSNYLFVVSMDVDPDKEALFNEVYDTEHVPNLLKVPGVHAAARMAGEPFVLNIGGEEKRIAQDGPRYTAIYEIDGPHVWALARRGAPLHPQPAARALQVALAALPSSADQSIARAVARAGAPSEPAMFRPRNMISVQRPESGARPVTCSAIRTPWLSSV